MTESESGPSGAGPLKAERHPTSCISYVSRSPSGKASTVYLKDGTMITIGRERETKGPAWLEIREQAKIILSSGVEAAQSCGSLPQGRVLGTEDKP